ncbi:MAG: arsenic metallochaperone ArsD family protein [Planctomycetota bacterium]
MVDGQIASQRIYPAREELAGWVAGQQVKLSLPVSMPSGGCCGNSDCC